MTIRVAPRTWSGRVAGCAALIAMIGGISAARAAAGANELANPYAPVVHCAWALVGASTPSGFAYESDDRARGDATAPSCAYDGTRGLPSQGSVGQPLLRLAFPEGAAREVELWAAVSSPVSDAFGAGNGSVRWEFANSSGVVMTSVPATDRSCAGTDAPGPMWSWASSGPGGIGALTDGAVTNSDRHGLWQLCRQGSVRLVSTHFVMPAEWPCGRYRVTVIANDGSASTSLSYTVDDICPPRVVLDTSAIAWQVEPGASNTVVGDFDPGTSAAPTITNLGGRAARIGVLVHPLVGVFNGGVIDTFSIAFATPDGGGSGEANLNANEPLWIEPSQLTLCPGESARLSLTVHAPASVPRGEYRGALT